MKNLIRYDFECNFLWCKYGFEMCLYKFNKWILNYVYKRYVVCIKKDVNFLKFYVKMWKKFYWDCFFFYMFEFVFFWVWWKVLLLIIYLLEKVLVYFLFFLYLKLR